MPTFWSNELTAVAGLVALAAITPGPNNLIVLRAASRAGLRGALPAIVGVVLGGLVVLGLAIVASRAAFAAVPGLRLITTASGCAYLAWLGLGLLRHSGQPAAGAAPASFLGVLAFQLLNPKAWVMVLTAASTPAAAPGLAAIFVVLPTACLLLWALAGAALARWLARPRVAVWVDRAMAVLLIATAVALAASIDS